MKPETIHNQAAQNILTRHGIEPEFADEVTRLNASVSA